jgi:predicted ATP-binding protein involved in virulence
VLKRLYVHNYKCLVNFEINFDQDISLFLGANGSGKSTVFEVLRKIIELLLDEKKIVNVFKNADKTRWLQREPQNFQFEMDVEIQSNIYKYLLTVDLGSYPSEAAKIKNESLYSNNEMLLESKEESDFDNARSYVPSGVAVDSHISYKIRPFGRICNKYLLFT